MRLEEFLDEGISSESNAYFAAQDMFESKSDEIIEKEIKLFEREFLLLECVFLRSVIVMAISRTYSCGRLGLGIIPLTQTSLYYRGTYKTILFFTP